MKNNKGFTLVELIAVMAVLSVLILIVIPPVNKIIQISRETSYNTQIDRIKKAAYDWTLKNPTLLPKEGESIVIFLGELKQKGFITIDTRNPLTEQIISNNSSITITNKDGDYSFEVNIIDINNLEEDSNIVLVINGSIIDYVEIGSNYEIPSSRAKTVDGEEISSSYISYQILKDDSVVSNIDTSSLGTYIINYSVTYNEEVSSYQKMVIIRDTISPEIKINGNLSITSSDTSINYLEGVTITDNSGEIITPTVTTSVNNLAGSYYVYYIATDSSGNSTTKRREVNVYNSSMVCNVPIGKVWTFDYTGTEQTFNVPCTGTYKLETWGAQGGLINGYVGGYGGYSTGSILIDSKQNIFINIGGMGTRDSCIGGYNGGGSISDKQNRFGATGGGATHMSLKSGELYTLEENKNTIFIVSGGGGGADNRSEGYGDGNGSSAGGYIGSTGSSINHTNGNGYGYGTGGTQTSGGVLAWIAGTQELNYDLRVHDGLFGRAALVPSSDIVSQSGGGGGYYGGGAGFHGGAGGGSSYIGNTALFDKAMYCYNCEESGVESIFTISTTGTSELRDTTACPDGYSTNPIAKCAKAGNGYARITLVSY